MKIVSYRIETASIVPNSINEIGRFSNRIYHNYSKFKYRNSNFAEFEIWLLKSNIIDLSNQIE